LTNPARIKPDALSILIVDSDLMPSSIMVKRCVLDDLGSFDPKYIFAEDWELNFRIGLKYPIVEIPSPLTQIRIHDNRKTADKLPHALGALDIRGKIESMRDILIKNDTTGEIVSAYKKQDLKYAEAYYRAGKCLGKKGDVKRAKEMLAEARRRNPFKLKYYTRSIEMALKS
jgi:hypothetical protein